MKSPGIVIRVDRKAFIFLCAVILVAALGRRLWSEMLTLTATYPAPSGIYNQLVTTGNVGAAPADTILNRNAGNVILAPPANVSGKVGIGTNSPAAKLDVAGDLGADSLRLNQGLQIGDDSSPCNGNKAGTLRWHAGKWEACDGSAWK